mgnify:CR=1 FL=1
MTLTSSAMSASILAAVPMAPRDPILGVTEAYVADPNPRKVNLGVGVYCDDNGKVPLLECVRSAERARVEAAPPHSYLPIDGLQAYDRAVMQLVFGSELAASSRVVTVQALGGTGGLKIGADFLRLFDPKAQVWISEPSWENHRALFEAAGFNVNAYPYYDAKTHGLDFESMRAALEKLAAVPDHVIRVTEDRGWRGFEKAAQPLLAALEGRAAQVLSIEEEQVEHGISRPARRSLGDLGRVPLVPRVLEDLGEPHREHRRV